MKKQATFKYLSTSVSKMVSSAEFKKVAAVPSLKGQLAEFRNSARKQRFIVGRILLAKLLGQSVYVITAPGYIKYGDHGKPYLANHDYHFNITDSADTLVVAISKQPIGIDLESIRPIELKRIRRAFTSDEQKYLDAIADSQAQSKAILKLWTVKEAVLKAAGVGLSGGVRKVKISDLHHAKWHENNYYIDDYLPDPDYVSTVAIYDK